ncbi:MAG: hypothetical protein ACJ751_01620 [Niastella sp.]|uniref:hypothetical protein n=1 Tax=Niastella sp. TaxID=1869183 RepID=UPI00389AAD2A
MKMLMRSLTTALLNVLTLKKISANEYRVKKYTLCFTNPVDKRPSNSHITKKTLAITINVDFFLLNNPQL